MHTTTTGSAEKSVVLADGERQAGRPSRAGAARYRTRGRRAVSNETLEHYLAEAGAAVALDLVDALEGALRQIREQPASGSLRHAHELNIPSLRFRPTGKFPYLVFYVERALGFDVWRVLRGPRDIPAWSR